MKQWRKFSVSAAIDPYVDWMREPGGAYVRESSKGDGFGLAIKLREGSGAAKFIRSVDRLAGKKHRKSITASLKRSSVGHGYCPESLVFEPAQSGGGVVSFLNLVEGEKKIARQVERITLAQKLPDDAYCSTGAPHAPENKKPQPGKFRADKSGTVVVGVIDEGIAFANTRFRRSVCDSRVEFAWMQDGTCRKGSCAGFYGREHRKKSWHQGGVRQHGIDRMLKDCLVAGAVDEEKFYRKAGLTDFARSGHKAAARRRAHGTHVMDTACGFDMQGGQGDNRPIVCVQLPTKTVADTSGLGLEKYLIDAIGYIFEKAQDIARQRNCSALPVVINFSSGILGGPHDGSHPIERVIEKMLKERRARYRQVATELVLPAGNSFLTQAHGVVELKKKQKKKLTWRLQPQDRTFNFMEIWLPRQNKPHAKTVSLKIRPPQAKASKFFGGGKKSCAYKWQPGGADAGIVCKAYYDFVVDENGKTGRGRFVIITLATAFHEAPSQLAPSGNWEIQLVNHTRKSKRVHAWIQWDDRPLSYPVVGRQSYFVDANYHRHDEVSGRVLQEDQPAAQIRRQGTINGIATAASVITVAGFYQKELRPVDYSAAGESDDISGGAEKIVSPLASVVSDDSVVQGGILAAGSFSGSRVIMNGTSVAAPQVTRWLADQLAKLPDNPANPAKSIGRKLIKKKAAKDEARRAKQRQSAPGKGSLKSRIGAGRMNIYHENLTVPQRLRQPAGRQS